jgi:hypothetical protein
MRKRLRLTPLRYRDPVEATEALLRIAALLAIPFAGWWVQYEVSRHQEHERVEERAAEILRNPSGFESSQARQEAFAAILHGTSQDQQTGLAFICEVDPEIGKTIATVVVESAGRSEDVRNYAAKLKETCNRRSISHAFRRQIEVADLYRRHDFSCDAALAFQRAGSTLPDTDPKSPAWIPIATNMELAEKAYANKDCRAAVRYYVEAFRAIPR